MDSGLDGDVALVTASSSGLGRASAEALAAEGANVVICGRSPERLAETEAALDSVGSGDVIGVQADVTDPDEVETLVATTVDEFGGLDHLVTSAGGVPPGEFTELKERDWYEAYDTLVMSLVWSITEARDHLVESEKGTITCITSRSVREVLDNLLLSNSVRRAVVGLVDTISREFAPDVRVNAVLPGAHETDRITELVESAIESGDYEDYEAGLADWASDVPMGRIGEPEELGNVVAFLASDLASYVNGAKVAVDGGSMRC
jgi:3-oxoacyl-[acyl-carrier protein] reductase